MKDGNKLMNVAQLKQTNEGGDRAASGPTPSEILRDIQLNYFSNHLFDTCTNSSLPVTGNDSTTPTLPPPQTSVPIQTILSERFPTTPFFSTSIDFTKIKYLVKLDTQHDKPIYIATGEDHIEENTEYDFTCRLICSAFELSNSLGYLFLGIRNSEQRLKDLLKQVKDLQDQMTQSSKTRKNLFDRIADLKNSLNSSG